MAHSNTQSQPPHRNLRWRTLVVILDLIAVALTLQIFLDQWIMRALAQFLDTPVILLLKFMPDDTVQLGLLCCFAIMFFVGYRLFSYDDLTADRGIFVFGSGVLALTIADLLKVVFGRSRPELFLSDGTYAFHFFAGSDGFDSFPSSHAALAFGIAGAVAVIWPTSRRVFLSLAVVVASARVLVGRHYVSDVIIGAALGLGAVALLQVIFALKTIALHKPAHELDRRTAVL